MKDWVLITGASSGIGRALAYKFAREKYNLVVVSRDEKKLDELASLLLKEFGIEVRVIAKDLAQPSAPREIFESVVGLGIHVSILVNNAGFGVHGEFATTEIGDELRLVSLQIAATLELTKLFLQPMISRRRGHLLNIASVYSFTPVPQQSVYSACKAFMLNFGESIRLEVARYGVRVTTVCPGSTRSEFRRRAHMKEKAAPGSSGMSAEAVATAAFNGCVNGQCIVVPGAINYFFALMSRILPRTFLPHLMLKINGLRGVNRP